MPCGTVVSAQIQRYILYRAEGCRGCISEEGIKECQENINYYKRNAKVIADTMTKLGIRFFGRYQLSVYLVRVPQWHGILGVL